ncbi:hypothetical protein HYSC106933_01400 [Hydrogenibacillus schlegelii]
MTPQKRPTGLTRMTIGAGLAALFAAGMALFLWAVAGAARGMWPVPDPGRPFDLTFQTPDGSGPAQVQRVPVDDETARYRGGVRRLVRERLEIGGGPIGRVTWLWWTFPDGEQALQIAVLVERPVDLRLALSAPGFDGATLRTPASRASGGTGKAFGERVWNGTPLPPAPVWLEADAPEGGQRAAFFAPVERTRVRENGVLEAVDPPEARPTWAPMEGGVYTTARLSAGERLDAWALLRTKAAAAPFVDWADGDAREILRLADFDRERPWTIEGPRYRTPDGYTPHCDRCYYVNPAQHIGEKLLQLMDRGTFFRDVVLLALDNAVRTQNAAGYWPITTRSEWLYRDYGIGPGYYDTRWSTDAALFLLEGYRTFGDEAYLQAAERYGNFLIDFVREHHDPTPSGGALVYDYGHPDRPEVRTHTSLNHLLAEMNFLYLLFEAAGRADARSAADRLLRAVEDTADRWPKANGDLHYARLPDGSFGLEDYPTLTLKDLRLSQAIVTRITGRPSAALAALIEQKESYLARRGIRP